MKLIDLKKQLPYKWRVQSFSTFDTTCSCVAYIDSRDVQNLLDEVCGPENWQDEYYQVKNTMLCKIGIKIDNEWVWKADGGTESDIESEKGELSDSFKRAAVKWGIGRFLYDLEIKKLNSSEKKTKNPVNYPYPVDDNGKKIWNITDHINGKLPFATATNITGFFKALKEGELVFSSGDEAIAHFKKHYSLYDNQVTEIKTRFSKEYI